MNSVQPVLNDTQRPRKLYAAHTASEYDIFEIAPANLALRYFLLTDLLAMLAASGMAALLAAHVNFYYFRRALFDAAATHTTLAAACALIAAALLLWFAHRQHYAQRLPIRQEAREIILGAGICALSHGFFLLLNHAEFSRLWLFGSWSFAAIFIILGRHALRMVLGRIGCWSIAALYIGDASDPRYVQDSLPPCREMGFRVCAQADEKVIAERLVTGEDWGSILASYGADAVLLRPQSRKEESRDLWILQWTRQKIPFAVVTPQTLNHAESIRRWLPHFGKRLFDLLTSTAALVVLTPVFLVLALLIKRDGGPVFHADTRVGIDGKLIKCLKFRSMIVNADQELVRYLRSNPAATAEWAHFQKLRHDPRITPVGRFIRKTSLDELPQLINVFWGEMTLVGPRPIIPNQKQAYGPNISYYHTVRPGITGLWQVSGRNRLTFRQRAKLDRWYVRHWSLWLDVVILFRTLPVLLLRKGAY